MSDLARCAGIWLRADGGVHAGAERPRVPDDEPEKTLRRFYDSASVMMGTVELRAEDTLHVSDNLAAATFFGTTPEAMQGRMARAVQEMSRGGRDAALVEGIVALARRLGLRVVAEGVETETQLGRLKNMRCEYAQRYLFAEPLTTKQAEALLAGTSVNSGFARD